MKPWVLVFLLVGLLGVTGCQQGATAKALALKLSVQKRVPCVGLVVYDGDTFACDLNHNGRVNKPVEQIRLLGIEASEMSYSKKNKSGKNQPLALEAKQALEQVVLNKTVWLVYDVQPSDKYGRTLAYVYTAPKGGLSVNEQLLKQGLAIVFFLGENRSLERVFLQAALAAKR